MKRFVPIITECAKGQQKYGVDFGGKFIHDSLKLNNISLEEPIYVKQRNFYNFYEGMETLKNVTSNVIKEKKFPLILGGDHSISYGSIKGVLEHYKHNLHVLWIDSHYYLYC